MNINQLVNTPIGQGRFQGPFTDSIMAPGDREAVLVRLPINEQTRDHLKQSNCLTPRATQSGLWLFAESDLKP